MKKLLKIVVGIVILFAVGIASIFYLTSGMTDTAEEFFAAVKAKNYQGAYRYLSEDFKASTTESDFTNFLERTALHKFKEASWSNRSISGGRGELDGSITTDTGGVVPVKLEFIKENEKWLIYSLSKPAAGIASGDNGKLPSEAEQVALVKESMQKFALAVNAKDFSGFHKHVAPLWQKQVTVEKFNEVFKPFIESEINLLPLENMSPVLQTKSSIDDNGVLTVEGYYPSQPSKVLFQFGYIYEGVSWKLIRSNVNVKPATDA